MFVKVVVLLLVLVLAVTSSMLVGTPVNADIKDPKIKQAVLFAIAAYNAKSESIYTSKVLKVINAQSQVVSGIKYTFTVKIATTSCKKMHAKRKCYVHSDPAIANPHKCKLAVWSQPWLKRMELVANTC
ncbi:cystatin-like [Clarias gariepinus]|uniref:cystatin-like n=1 Tax=Clarias gariepinus TaxID=13013 RepID=UPI00234C374E|nr:cystatin-like [Clarias gariepinus]